MRYYPSNIHGTKIRNAITGKQYTSFVGSKDEKKFFRVIDATGLYDGNGKSSSCRAWL